MIHMLQTIEVELVVHSSIYRILYCINDYDNSFYIKIKYFYNIK
jgi:hypothetical protein